MKNKNENRKVLILDAVEKGVCENGTFYRFYWEDKNGRYYDDDIRYFGYTKEEAKNRSKQHILESL